MAQDPIDQEMNINMQQHLFLIIIIVAITTPHAMVAYGGQVPLC